MSTSRQSFSQVKDILKKLDQGIEAARAKRTRDQPPASVPGQGTGAAQPPRHDQARPGVARPSGLGAGQGGTGPGNPFQRRVG